MNNSLKKHVLLEIIDSVTKNKLTIALITCTVLVIGTFFYCTFNKPAYQISAYFRVPINIRNVDNLNLIDIWSENYLFSRFIEELGTRNVQKSVFEHYVAPNSSMKFSAFSEKITIYQCIDETTWRQEQCQRVISGGAMNNNHAAILTYNSDTIESAYEIVNQVVGLAATKVVNALLYNIQLEIKLLEKDLLYWQNVTGTQMVVFQIEAAGFDYAAELPISLVLTNMAKIQINLSKRLTWLDDYAQFSNEKDYFFSLIDVEISDELVETRRGSIVAYLFTMGLVGFLISLLYVNMRR